MKYLNIIISIYTGLGFFNDVSGQVDPIRIPPEYETEISELDIINYTIDEGKEVGVIAGTHGVSATGGATYSIPIQVPPGTNGVQPELALTYNSQALDGYLGLGWGLMGASAIVRTGQDWFHDGVTLPISYGTTDRFGWDGQRLVMTSSGMDYGDAGSTYDTEAASFALVTAQGSSGSGPDHFTVVTKSGTYLEFGKTSGNGSQSKMLSTGNGEVLAWRLNKLMDAFGNYITYFYDEDDNEHLLTRIKYTGNAAAGISPYNEVEFQYMLRTDLNEQFVAGSESKLRHLLKNIIITCEGEHFKTYELSYCLREVDKSYLRSIKEIGADGIKALNPTLVHYGDLDPNELEVGDPPTPFAVSDLPALVMFDADIDGDGDDELIASPSINDAGPYDIFHNEELNVLAWDRINGEFINTALIQLPTSSMLLSDYWVPSARTTSRTGDFNGDGRDDLILVNREPVGGEAHLNFVRIHFSTTTDATVEATFDVEDYYPPVPFEFTSNGNFIYLGDFNGDGIDDWLTVLRAFGSPSHVAFLSSPGFENQLLTTSYANWIAEADDNIVMDFDGDGAAELYSRQGTSGRVLKLSSSNELNAVFNGTTSYYDVVPGDFNGDGKTDLLAYIGDQTWGIAYSTGVNFEFVEFDQFPGAIDLEVMDTPEIDRLLVSDLNGDGRSDILLANGSTSPMDLTGYLSRGNGSSFFELDLSPYMNCNAGNIPRLSIDLNGDGRGEMINAGASEDAPCFDFEVYFSRYNWHERSAEHIMDGMGNAVRFSYDFLTNNDLYEMGGPDRTYPNVSIQPALEAVSEMQVPSGSIETYQYGFGQINRQGKGFLGFARSSARNEVMNSARSLRRTFNDDHALFVPLWESTHTWDDPLPISTLYHTMVIDDLGDRYLVKETSTMSVNDLSGAITTVENSDWDAFGNIESSTTDINGITVIETNTTWVAAGPSAVPSKPEDIIVSKHRDPASAVVCTTSFDYDGATGALTRKAEFAGLPKALITNYSYHTTGNLHQTTQYHAAIGGLFDHRRTVATYTADAKYRSPTEFTKRWYNPPTPSLIDISAHSTYDPKWGKPLSTLSTDGLTTLFEYDDFGRLVLVSAPHVGGTERYEINTTRDWDISVDHCYYELVTHPGEADVKTWYDQLGRAVMTETEAFGTDDIIASKTYDARGNVATTTAPHLPGEPELVTTYEYDDYNRPWTAENTLTGITETTYDYANEKLTTTVIKASGQEHSTTVDATGLTVIAIDDGGELIYEYDSWSNLLKVSRGGGLILAENTYDSYGRQLTLDDADAGLTTYEYNAFGELVYEKDANNKETTFAYDNLGRLKTRGGTAGTTTYEYFYDGTKFNDNLKKVIGLGTTFEYFYNDTYNRLSKEKRTINGVAYNTEYTYDIYDKVETMTYPSSTGLPGLEISYSYGADGSILDVVGPGSETLFHGISKNGLGQWMEYEMADGNVMTIDRNFGFPKGYYAAGNFNAQDLKMEYDYETGNVSYRWDRLKGRKESFTYDLLDRLTSAKVDIVDNNGNPLTSGIVENDFVYDASRGNLIQKSEIGQFKYENAHAISSAHGLNYPVPSDDPPAVISHEQQDIFYTAFSKVNRIQENVGGVTHLLNYFYGTDYERVRATLKQNSIQVEERIYVGGYERIIRGGQSFEIHYIRGGDGLCAIVVHDQALNTWTTYTAYKDHLGSILTLAYEDGLDFETIEQSFDPWGRQRNPTTWQYGSLPTQPLWFYRGFTGHEHVEPFVLINMNGRMYDPLNGRMLSPDNFINGSSTSQSYNRYSYAANNPLRFTDPTGNTLEFPFAGGIVWNGSTTASNGFDNPFLQVVSTVALMAAPAIIGPAVTNAVAGALPSTVGGFIGGFTPAFAGGFAAGFAAGSLASAMQSNNLDKIVGDGMRSGLIAGALQGVPAGISSGIEATSHGASFLTGTRQFSLENGFGAHDIGMPWPDNVRGTYIETYRGADIYESGSLGPHAGICLPPDGILLGPGAWKRDPYLFWHEYGHWLTYEEIGAIKYYGLIAPASFDSALRQTFGIGVHYHKTFWTEVMANNMARRWLEMTPAKWLYESGYRFPLDYENYDWLPLFRAWPNLW